jgi:predicted amidohydrolase YtcJ
MRIRKGGCLRNESRWRRHCGAYTTDAAYAQFAETRKGRLASRYLADVVMLDQDVFTLPPERIREAKVALTVSGGRVLVER